MHALARCQLRSQVSNSSYSRVWHFFLPFFLAAHFYFIFFTLALGKKLVLPWPFFLYLPIQFPCSAVSSCLCTWSAIFPFFRTFKYVYKDMKTVVRQDVAERPNFFFFLVELAKFVLFASLSIRKSRYYLCTNLIGHDNPHWTWKLHLGGIQLEFLGYCLPGLGLDQAAIITKLRKNPLFSILFSANDMCKTLNVHEGLNFRPSRIGKFVNFKGGVQPFQNFA